MVVLNLGIVFWTSCPKVRSLQLSNTTQISVEALIIIRYIGKNQLNILIIVRRKNFTSFKIMISYLIKDFISFNKVLFRCVIFFF